MPLEPITGTAPSSWAPYFINGDASGMTRVEIDAADRFASWLGGSIVSCDDAGFLRWHDAQPFYDFAADCQTYTALVERD